MKVIEAFTAEEYRNTNEMEIIPFECCAKHLEHQEDGGWSGSGENDPGGQPHLHQHVLKKCTNEHNLHRYTGRSNIKLLKLNVPSLYPLKPQNTSAQVKPLNNIYVNKLEVSNFVKEVNYIELPPPRGVILPDPLPKGTKFLIITADGTPENGVLVLV